MSGWQQLMLAGDLAASHRSRDRWLSFFVAAIVIFIIVAINFAIVVFMSENESSPPPRPPLTVADLVSTPVTPLSNQPRE